MPSRLTPLSIARTHAPIPTHAHTHTRTHTRTHARTHAHTRTHTHTHTRTHARARAHTHTHTHARTHKQYFPARARVCFVRNEPPYISMLSAFPVGKCEHLHTSALNAFAHDRLPNRAMFNGKNINKARKRRGIKIRLRAKASKGKVGVRGGREKGETTVTGPAVEE